MTTPNWIRLASAAAFAALVVACGGDHHDARKTNGLIASEWQGEGIYLLDPATSRRRLIPRTGSAVDVAWSPDGRSLAFEVPGKVEGLDVYTIRSDGRDRQLVLENASAPSWSPDGERLLVARDTCTGYSDYGSNCTFYDPRVDLYTVRPDGAHLRHIAQEPNGVWSPSWSPDGKRIAFLTNDGGLDLVDADGGDKRGLDGRFGSVLSWSPDGSSLAFDIVGKAPDWGDIGVVDVETGKRRNLTHRPGQDSAPAWSPDGRLIVFVADMSCMWTGKCKPVEGAEGGPRELWVMDADGKHLRQLTKDGGLGYNPPAWQPVRGSILRRNP
jgi:Tol biopolymer transport system component